MRTLDIGILSRATDQCATELMHLNVDEWLSNTNNVALTNDNGDVAMFERQYRQPNTVCGHYFFHSRGKQARQAAQELLAEAFTGPYGIEIIVGLTPTTHKGALWMNKQLGFKSHGQIDTSAGPCELVILTKKEWESTQ